MKEIKSKLEKTRGQLVKLAEKRDKSYSSKSEKWQDSDKGVAYEVDTMLIADVVADLDKAIYNANLFLKN
mgnify:CR=1 FL=1